MYNIAHFYFFFVYFAEPLGHIPCHPSKATIAIFHSSSAIFIALKFDVCDRYHT